MAVAQEYNIEYDEMLQSSMPHFEDLSYGMKEKNCRLVFEDAEGYIWMATHNGICRYDGIAYKHFFYREYARNRNQNNVTALCEDTIYNCIWGVTDIDQTLLRVDKKTLEQFSMPIKTENGKPFQFALLFNYNDSLLFASTKSGMVLVNKNTGYARGPFLDKTSPRPIALAGHVVSLRGETFISLDGKLRRFNGRNPDVPEFEDVFQENGAIVRNISPWGDSAVVFEKMVSKSGRGDKVKFMSYNLKTRSSRVLGVSDANAYGIAVCADGIWYSINGGLNFMDLSTGASRSIDVSNTPIRDNRVNSLVKSKHQPIVWMSSSEGLLKTDYYYSKFCRVDMRTVSDNTSVSIYSICRDSHGNYWIGSTKGVLVKWKGAERFVKYIDIEVFQKPGHQSRWAIFGMVEDVKNNVLYLRSYRTLFVYDYKSRLVSKIMDCNVAGVALDNENNLLVASGNDLLKYNPTTKKTSVVLHDYISDERRVTSVAFDGDSVLWIGMNGGEIASYNVLNNTFAKQAMLGSEPHPVTSLRCLKRNGQREVWALAGKSGLNYYLPDKHHLTIVDHGDLLQGQVNNVEIDNVNNVWIGCSDGIVCLNSTNGRYYEYPSSLFPLFTSVNAGASYVSTDGTVLIAGRNNYFVEFDSKNFARNKYYPTPIVNSYRFFDSSAFDYDSCVESEYYGDTDTIDVPASVRSLQVTLRVLNYSNSINNKIQWRMPEVDENWTSTNTVSPLVFADIPRGMNVVEIRSCDSDGNPTSNMRRLYINKHVYFFRHPLFHLAIVLVVFIAVAGGILIKNRIDEMRRIRLQKEVERQAGELVIANEQLMKNKVMIEKQNAELIEHRNNLEQQVIDRTRDLEQAKLKAEENSKLKSAFLANLSHEVRTPMNCIVGFSKLLADPACKPSDQKEFIHLIQESSQSLLVLIGDLLDVSRIESGQLRVNKNDFEVSREVYDVFRILSVERKNPNVAFELFADDGLRGRIIYSDKERFRQIIINICYNAFKFTDKGHVHLYADVILKEQLPAYDYPDSLPLPDTVLDLLLVRIEDTGIGIPSDKQEVIFEPFRKLNNNKTLYPGLGLGLNIVKNLVRILDGNIWLTSTEGKGTTFYFYLPF